MAEFEIPYAKQLNKGTRKELGYVIGHQGDNPVVRLIPSGRRLVIRSSHLQTIEKSPGIISLIEQSIQGAKRQRFNDLISEIRDFYAEESPSPGVPHEHNIFPLDIERSRRDEQMEEPEPTSHVQQVYPETALPEDITTEAPDPPQTETIHDSNHGRHESPNDPTPRTNTPSAGPQQARRSTRSGAQKPPGYYAKLASGESVADYTACHLRAAECSRLYGDDLTKEAGTTEVLNMIRDRKAACPQDYRKLSPRVIQEAVSSFMFFKAKDLLPDETHATTTGPSTSHSKAEASATDWTQVMSKRARKMNKRVKIRGRWVGGGHQQQRGEVLAERVAPTARGTTHSILMAIAAFEGRKLLVGDIPSAYLQADHVPANGKAVHIIADRYTTKLIVEAMPVFDFFRYQLDPADSFYQYARPGCLYTS